MTGIRQLTSSARYVCVRTEWNTAVWLGQRRRAARCEELRREWHAAIGGAGGAGQEDMACAETHTDRGLAKPPACM